MGGKIGRKKRKKKGEKKKRRKKRRSKQNKRKEREKEWEEDRMKNRKEKERKKSWDQVLNKRKYCVGTEPSALVYICILVTSTTTGHDGSVVRALASQAKGRGSIPTYGTSFFPTSIFYLPFPTSLGK